ncbi:MAG: type II secretion system F family protein [Campylobacterota bacterium]|nr:type II secretion system F family protein [Campylobacterota bacterium]
MKQYKITYLKNAKPSYTTLDQNSIKEFPYSIIKIQEIKSFYHLFELFSTVTQEDITSMFSQMNMMLQADLSMIDTIELLLENESKKKLKDILKTIRDTLKQGKLLEDELEQFSQELGEFSISFLSLGQRDGNLKDSVAVLVQILEEKNRTKKMYMNALNYPMVLGLTFIAALGVIFGYVVPQFEPLFTQYGDNLPYTTKTLLSVKYFFHHYAMVFIATVVFVCISVYVSYKQSLKYKEVLDRFMVVYVPILGKLILLSNVLILFLTLSLLLKQKHTFQSALHSAVKLIQNRYLKSIFEKAHGDIVKGKSIQSAFEKVKYFDNLVQKLLIIGHRSNQFEAVLDKIVKIYQTRYTDTLVKIIKLIEPLFLLIIALLVVWMMLAIFVPMWQMSTVL